MSVTEGELQELTRFLRAWSNGEHDALEQLVPRVQHELHRLARRHMANERLNHSLQTTALINEAYVRLIGGKKVQWQDRQHFFAVASQLMRRILVDMAKSRRRLKRGGGLQNAVFEEESFVFRPDRSGDIVVLDEAMAALAEIDPRKTQIVEMRFFGGLSVAETAAVLGISDRTVRREWNYSKAWLRHVIEDGVSREKERAQRLQSPKGSL